MRTGVVIGEEEYTLSKLEKTFAEKIFKTEELQQNCKFRRNKNSL